MDFRRAFVAGFALASIGAPKFVKVTAQPTQVREPQPRPRACSGLNALVESRKLPRTRTQFVFFSVSSVHSVLKDSLW